MIVQLPITTLLQGKVGDVDPDESTLTEGTGNTDPPKGEKVSKIPLL